jgi:hypothetical protein
VVLLMNLPSSESIIWLTLAMKCDLFHRFALRFALVTPSSPYLYFRSPMCTTEDKTLSSPVSDDVDGAT